MRFKSTFLSVIILFALNGCFSGPTMQMFKDGNIYYPDWSKYDVCYPNDSYAACYKNNKKIETLYPLSDKQISYLRYEENQKQQAWNSINQAIKSVGDSYKEQAKSYNSLTKSMQPNTTIIYPNNYKGWIPVR